MIPNLTKNLLVTLYYETNQNNNNFSITVVKCMQNREKFILSFIQE